MKNQEINLTTAQFAAIHEVNPRTLHYYDSVGLFSPERKGRISTVIIPAVRVLILNISVC